MINEFTDYELDMIWVAVRHYIEHYEKDRANIVKDMQVLYHKVREKILERTT